MSAETDGAPIAAWIESVIQKRLEDDTLVLPSLPVITMRCVELVRGDTVNIPQLAETVAKEPTLVARVLRAAAGAAVAQPLKLDIADALGRVGTKNLRALFFESSGRKVVFSKDPRIAALARKTWEHSLAVATLARDLSALSGRTTSEADYIGGLLHDIGKPVVMAMLLDAERQMADRSQKFIDPAAWSFVLAKVHRKVGTALAIKWKLPAAIADCVRDCSEYNNADRTSIVNTVCLANALAKLHDCAAGPVDPEDLHALLMIGRSLLGVTEDVLKKMALELPERTAGLFE